METHIQRGGWGRQDPSGRATHADCCRIGFSAYDPQGGPKTDALRLASSLRLLGGVPLAAGSAGLRRYWPAAGTRWGADG